MTYAYAVRYIMNSPPASSETPPASLRFLLVMRLLGNPHTGLKYITVCGAFENNTTARMVQCVLKGTKYKTGMLLSDAAVSKDSVRNSVLIDGKTVEPELFSSAVGKVYHVAEDVKRSYNAVKTGAGSEMGINAITAMLYERGVSPVLTREEVLYAVASLIFMRTGCDLVITTSGFGGRSSPCVSMPEPVAVVVGSMSDNASPSSELAVIRKGVREVVTENQTPSDFGAISGRCAEVGARLTVTARAELKITQHSLSGTEFSYRNSRRFRLSSPIATRIFRAISVIELVRALSRHGMNITDEEIDTGLRSLKSEAFFDPIVVSADPLIIVTPLDSSVGISDLFISVNDIKRPTDGSLYIFFDEMSAASCLKLFETLQNLMRDKYAEIVVPKKAEAEVSLIVPESLLNIRYIEGSVYETVFGLLQKDTMIVFTSAPRAESVRDKLRQAISRKNIGRKNK